MLCYFTGSIRMKGQYSWGRRFLPQLPSPCLRPCIHGRVWGVLCDSVVHHQLGLKLDIITGVTHNRAAGGTMRLMIPHGRGI